MTLGAVAVGQFFIDSDLVVAGLGVAIAIMSALLQFTAAKDRETEARLFAEKRTVYVSLIQTIMGVFNKKGAPQSASEEAKLVKALQDIRTQLIIWGSFRTVHAIDKMGSLGNPGDKTPEAKAVSATEWMAELVGSIRSDLGHKDPAGSQIEMALGMLIEPDRSNVRQMVKKR